MPKMVSEMEIAPQSSVTVAKNAKGEISWEIKVYTDNVVAAVANIKATTDEIKKQFNLP